MVTQAPARPARKSESEAPRWYTPSEVAELLSIDQRTIRRWIENRQIEAVQLPGRHWRIAPSEVDRILREGASPRWEDDPKIRRNTRERERRRASKAAAGEAV